MLSWDGAYDDARKQLQIVLAASPDHGDALPALINVELWSDHPERAVDLAQDALKRKPGNPVLLLALARGLRAKRDLPAAEAVVERLLAADPGNEDGRKLQRVLNDEGKRLQTGISQSGEWFNDGSKPWYETQITLRQSLHSGSLIGRFSQAQRFGMTGRQSEVEYYPRIRPGTYAYLGAGYSPDARLYARHRLGAELFQSVGRGIELSGGFRLLSFGEKVRIYTGSVGKYRGNWYLSVRTFLTPDITGTSRSFQFLARRYLGSGASYFGLRFGHGSTPIEARSIQDVSILRSNSVACEWVGQITKDLSWNVRSGFSREDRVYRSRLLRYYSDGGLMFRF
jgi:YaiO family outer membrane protein